MVRFLQQVVLYPGQLGHYHIGRVQVLGSGKGLGGARVLVRLETNMFITYKITN